MCRKISVLFFAVWFVGKLAMAQNGGPGLGIIPAPVSVKKLVGDFAISQETVIAADTVNNKAVQFLADYLKNKFALNNLLKPNTGQNGSNTIILTSKGAENLPAEGYRLTITPEQVTIAANGAGLFYGIQTLIQLMPLERAAVIRLPAAVVEDYPRFGYRGLHLDVSRHFFSVEFVKKYIDLMAAYKLNNFHWHLTDDQGWRIEIKKYPKLTTVGGFRAQTMIGSFRDRTPEQYDNTPYGGFYTQEQIKDVVKYAAARYINVIPEIEMPGHSEAALAAYPELGCSSGQAYKVSETWGVFDDVYCPTEQTFGFLEDVLTEVMALFPSKYIHIGGDEVKKVVWQKSEFCQKLIKRLKLKDEHGLQSYFIQRMEKFLNAKGRSIIGWDEILEGGLAPNATVMSWRGEAGGIEAARKMHNVIMTPGSGGLYIDHGQGKVNEPLNIGGAEPLQKIYSYNPVSVALAPDQQKYILGVQANLWTEYVGTDLKAEYMLLPRLFALSEIAWSPLANKDFKDFSETRLPKHLALLDKSNTNYRVPTAVGATDTTMIGSQLNMTLKTPVAGAKIYYSIDGYTPRETDLEYQKPITLPVPEDQYREVQTIVITPSGKRSQVTRTVMFNKTPMAAVNFQGTGSGLKYQLIPGAFNSSRQLDGAAATDTGIIRSFNLPLFKKTNHTFGVIYTGFIRVENDGKYGFSIQSDDGSVLMIDDQVIVDNDGKHALKLQSGDALLMKGFHKFTLKYFDAGEAGALRVYMTIPGKPRGELSPDSIFN